MISSKASKLLRVWIDKSADEPSSAHAGIDWIRVAPFVLLHLACLGVFFTGVSTAALVVAGLMFAIRMFAITGFYHRYFSHRSFRTSRPMQFVFGLLGASAVQCGPLWWAAHHRHHHKAADTEADLHSPVTKSFFRSHMGWFLRNEAFHTDLRAIPDLATFPELRWIDRFDVLIAVALAVALFVLGELAPLSWNTSGLQMLVWGFFVSTVCLFHATVTINSLAHRFGRRRYATRDHSRNNWWLALLTFGEGWHNNHHHFPGSARQGFFWWEVDLTWYLLKGMSWLGLVWDLKPVPARVRSARLIER